MNKLLGVLCVAVLVAACGGGSTAGDGGGGSGGGDGGLLEDGGSKDAGPAFDAGRQPQSDGGAPVDFVAVADETTFAFAWTARQNSSFVSQWELNALLGDAGRLPEVYVSPSSARTYLLTAPAMTTADGGSVGTGESFKYFVSGVDTMKLVVPGEAPDAGTEVVDSGSMCTVATQCPPEKVCDLGQCKVQTCQSGSTNTCPSGYQCQSDMACHRLFSDAGTVDAGVRDAGTFVSRPLVSDSVTIATGIPGFSAGIPVGGYVSKRPDIIAVDSARQLISVEQEGQLFGHFTEVRGKDLPNDNGTAAPIDTTGTRVRMTYNAESNTVFACYTVGRGVRVRRSRDLGKSWGTVAETLLPADDGGFSSTFKDCALAPWKNGGALMVTVDDDQLNVRSITEALSVSTPEAAFTASNPVDGDGGIYLPSSPAIATSPVDSVVHIGFTGTRPVGISTDTEIYGVFRDGTQPYSSPLQISNSVAGGTGLPQNNVTLVVEKGTKRALAAYASLEPSTSDTYSTIYTSLFNPSTKKWGTGSDLTVMAQKQSTYLLFPARNPADQWDAFSPSLAITPAGKIFLSMVAGKRIQGGIDLRMYLVGFSFNEQSPLATAKGWYLAPAQKMSETRVLDPRAPSTQVPPNVSALTADGQISVYGTFIEGVGTNAEIENRAILVTRP